MNAENFRLTAPKIYHESFFKEEIRSDGRGLLDHRSLQVESGSLGFGNGSSQVAIGNTKVLCGIKSELLTSKPGDHIMDFITVKVSFPFISTQSLRPNQTLEQTQVSNFIIQNFIESTNILKVEDLIEGEGKLFWTLACELVCQEDDGCFYDACSVALLCALNNLKLPRVTFHEESGQPRFDYNEKRPLKLGSRPLMVTFATWNRDILLTDPTKEEEELGEGTVTVSYEVATGCFNIFREGGCALDTKMIDRCHLGARKRSQKIMAELQLKPTLL